MYFIEDGGLTKQKQSLKFKEAQTLERKAQTHYKCAIFIKFSQYVTQKPCSLQKCTFFLHHVVLLMVFNTWVSNRLQN